MGTPKSGLGSFVMIDPVTGERKVVKEDQQQESFPLLCRECNSGEHIVKWDNKSKPCPKCGTGMEKDPSFSMIYD